MRASEIDFRCACTWCLAPLGREVSFDRASRLISLDFGFITTPLPRRMLAASRTHKNKKTDLRLSSADTSPGRTPEKETSPAPAQQWEAPSETRTPPSISPAISPALPAVSASQRTRWVPPIGYIPSRRQVCVRASSRAFMRVRVSVSASPCGVWCKMYHTVCDESINLSTLAVLHSYLMYMCRHVHI